MQLSFVSFTLIPPLYFKMALNKFSELNAPHLTVPSIWIGLWQQHSMHLETFPNLRQILPWADFSMIVLTMVN